MSDTHAGALDPRAGSPPAHEPAQHEELASGSASANRTAQPASFPLPGHAASEPAVLVGLREMVDSLGMQLDLLYAERDAERAPAACEVTALRSTVASLTEQLVEFYALQEQQAQLDGRSLADLVASAALAHTRAPATGC